MSFSNKAIPPHQHHSVVLPVIYLVIAVIILLKLLHWVYTYLSFRYFSRPRYSPPPPPPARHHQYDHYRERNIHHRQRGPRGEEEDAYMYQDDRQREYRDRY